MKASYFVLIFLLASPLTEKEACNSSEDKRKSGKRPWIGLETISTGLGRRNSEEDALVETEAANMHKAVDPAGPNDVMDSEDEWWEDHKVLPRVGSSSEVLGPKSEHDSTIESIKKEVEAFEESDSLCPTPTKHFTPTKELMSEKGANWRKFFAGINNCNTYAKDSEVVKDLLKDMETMEIRRVRIQGGGSQMKFLIIFDKGQEAIFKPSRFGIDYEDDPNQFQDGIVERGNAEIAAFHLDKLLDFRRAIPTVGRVLSIPDMVKSNAVLKHFKSPGNNQCLVGKCETYCDTAHALCGDPDMIRGSVQVMLPDEELELKSKPSQYSRHYDEEQTVERWRYDKNFCKDVKKQYNYEHGRLLLDVVDLHILDFITGNPDRHELYVFDVFSTYSFNTASVSYIVPIDNGKGFVSTKDDFAILEPLRQCCVFRPSTVKTLLSFYFGERTLGQALNESMNEAQTNSEKSFDPVLADKYLIAVDRRIEEILRVIAKCIKNAKGRLENVLMNQFNVKSHRPVTATKRRMMNDTSDRDVTAVDQDEQPRGTLFQQRKFQNRLVSTRNGRVSIPKPEIDENLKTALLETWKVHEYVEHDVECPKEITYEQLYQEPSPKRQEWWNEFRRQVSNCHMYPKQGDNVQHLLQHMSKAKITSVYYAESKSQLKLTLTLKKAQTAILKPMSRFYESNPNHFYFDDFERPHAEIAAFHLDRLLGFRRALPTTGRIFQIPDKEQSSKDTNPFFLMTIKESPAGRRCLDVRRQCEKYCDSAHPICGNRDNLIQGSVQVWLDQYKSEPEPKFVTRRWESPYHKNFSDDYILTSKQTEDDHCDTLKKTPPYNQGRRLPDLVDLSILDFITGNQERDYYETVSISPDDPDGFIANTENGKGFGNPHKDKDDQKILAPLTQCCVVRPSTVNTLLKFYLGEDSLSLAQEVEKSLRPDPMYPVLATKYFRAIDGRVEKVLRAVADCIVKAKGDLTKVLMNHFPPKQDATIMDEESK